MAFWIVAMVFAIWATRQVFSYGMHNLSTRKYRALSWPAKKVWAAYLSIPKDHRPKGDLYESLKALDVKHGGCKAVSAKFYRNHYDYGSYSWQYGYGSDAHKDFSSLNDSFVRLSSTLEKQKHVLTVERVSDRIEEAKRMAAEANDYAKIVTEVTKEMT